LPTFARNPGKIAEKIEVWHQISGGKGTIILREVLMASAVEDSLRCREKSVTLLR